MTDSEMHACLAQLEELYSEINSIMSLLEGKQQLFGTDKSLAQQKLNAIKTKLKDEYRRTSSVKGRASLNPIERDFYAPAVHEARTRIHVKTNSIPDSRWVSDLYDAADSINHYIFDLRKCLGMSDKSD